jgi:methyl-accepting chemotaxis protein
VEEATSASQSMKEQARALMHQVGSFKVTVNGQKSSGKPAVVPVTHESSATQVKKPLFKKPDVSHATVLEPVGVASGNGKDRLQKDNDFEEF